MGQFTDLLPVASFIAGITGSLHCVGMCGGLVAASCNEGKDVFKYQLGRLLGYLVLGSVAFVLGYALKSVVNFTWAPLLSGLFIGVLFIYWGIQSYRGKKAEIPLPGFLRRSYQILFRRYAGKESRYRSGLIGLFSIMLPCGLLYGLIIAALALGTYQEILISLGFFWLGTLPAMMGAPHIVRKVLSPLQKKLPKVYAIIFIIIGLTTIVSRLNHLPSSHHHADYSKDGEVHRCH